MSKAAKGDTDKNLNDVTEKLTADCNIKSSDSEEEFHDVESDSNLSQNNDHQTYSSLNKSEVIDDLENKENELELRKKSEDALSDEELEKRKIDSIDLKKEGNNLYADSNYSEAIAKYTDSLQLCPLKFTDERAFMFNNRSICHNKSVSFFIDTQGDKKKAIEDCNNAIDLKTDYKKCLLRRGELNIELEMLEAALKDFEKVLEIDPNDQLARMKCATLPQQITEQHEKMKAEMMGQLKQLGNMFLKPFGMSTDNFKLTQDPNSGGYSVNFVKQ